MNHLRIGFARQVSPPSGNFLFIHDDLPPLPPYSRVFDPLKHSFNPIADIEYKDARLLADVLYTIYPQGQDTLTVRNGRRALTRLFLKDFGRLDRIMKWLKDKEKEDQLSPPQAEALATLSDILLSPVLDAVFNAKNDPFSFRDNGAIFARVSRAELGDFDALVLGLTLIGHFKGQLVVPDFGFYGRDAHISLIRQNRLIAGVNFLQEMPPRLRSQALLIEDKIGRGATAPDADTLAIYAGLRPDPLRENSPYNDFIRDAMSAD